LEFEEGEKKGKKRVLYLRSGISGSKGVRQSTVLYDRLDIFSSLSGQHFVFVKTFLSSKE